MSNTPSSRLTPADQARALLAAADAAKPPPWDKRIAGIEGDSRVAGTGPWYKVHNGVGYGPDESDKADADAAFIALARNSAEAICRRLLVLEEERVRLRMALAAEVRDDLNDGWKPRPSALALLGLTGISAKALRGALRRIATGNENTEPRSANDQAARTPDSGNAGKTPATGANS